MLTSQTNQVVLIQRCRVTCHLNLSMEVKRVRFDRISLVRIKINISIQAERFVNQIWRIFRTLFWKTMWNFYKIRSTSATTFVISNWHWWFHANLIGMLWRTIFNCFSTFITIFLNYYRSLGIVLDQVGCRFSASNTESWILFCLRCKGLNTFQGLLQH